MGSPLLLRRLIALVERQARFSDTVSSRVDTMISRIILRMPHDAWYHDPQVHAMADQVGHVVRSGQEARAQSMRAYLMHATREIGMPMPRNGVEVTLPDQVATGVTAREEYARVAETYRYWVSQGETTQVALSRAATRAQTRADLTMQRAETIASQETLRAIGVKQWRRIIHPELARVSHMSCGLCVVASDRIYHTSNLMPIHAGCNCTVLPIIDINGEKVDPGASINGAALKAIYAAAGGDGAPTTDGWALKRVQVAVDQHGELGPILAPATNNSRVPRKRAAKDVPTR